MANKKRIRSTFDAVQHLESEDEREEKLRRKRTKREIARSRAARQQTNIYSDLMAVRILLQRSLQQESRVSEDASDNPDLISCCDDLLSNLLQARAKLVADDHDEEQDASIEEVVQDEDKLAKLLQSQYKMCQNSWKEVLNRRHHDVRLHAGLAAKTRFQALDSTFWDQVQATIEHEKFTMNNRQHEDDGDDKEESATVPSFDDSKLYQLMLKDFLVSSSSDTHNVGPSNFRNTKKSSKPKKQVDRRASKGRKLRYVEIPKLQNFTFPVQRQKTGSNMDEEEWFKSLFGGVGLSS